MITSQTVSSFWSFYGELPIEAKKAARKAYKLWRQNPFYPSLKFKCVKQQENIWSLRVSEGHRALCIFEGPTVTWFWIGDHDSDMRLIRS